MKKLIIPLTFCILTLAIGYVLGGLRSGRIATEQAYHSNLNFFVAIDRHLQNHEIAEAKKVLTHGIGGALKVLDTFDNEPRSALAFVLPSSEVLLNRETRDRIRSLAETAVSPEEISRAPSQSQ